MNISFPSYVPTGPARPKPIKGLVSLVYGNRKPNGFAKPSGNDIRRFYLPDAIRAYHVLPEAGGMEAEFFFWNGNNEVLETSGPSAQLAAILAMAHARRPFNLPKDTSIIASGQLAEERNKGTGTRLAQPDLLVEKASLASEETADDKLTIVIAVGAAQDFAKAGAVKVIRVGQLRRNIAATSSGVIWVDLGDSELDDLLKALRSRHFEHVAPAAGLIIIATLTISAVVTSYGWTPIFLRASNQSAGISTAIDDFCDGEHPVKIVIADFGAGSDVFLAQLAKYLRVAGQIEGGFTVVSKKEFLNPAGDDTAALKLARQEEATFVAWGLISGDKSGYIVEPRLTTPCGSFAQKRSDCVYVTDVTLEPFCLPKMAPLAKLQNTDIDAAAFVFAQAILSEMAGKYLSGGRNTALHGMLSAFMAGAAVYGRQIHPSLWGAEGYALASLGRYTEAETSFAKAWQLGQGSWAMMAIAQIRGSRGDLASAKKIIDKVLEEEPNIPQGLAIRSYLGRAEYRSTTNEVTRRESREASLRDVRKALDTDPLFWPARVELASWYEIDGRLDDAIKELRVCSEQSHGASFVLVELGRLLGRSGSSKEAAEMAGVILKKYPGDGRALELRADAHRVLKQYDDAIKDILAALSMVGEDSQGRQRLLGKAAIAYFHADRCQEAMVTLGKYEWPSGSQKSCWRFANAPCLMSMGDIEKASETLADIDQGGLDCLSLFECELVGAIVSAGRAKVFKPAGASVERRDVDSLEKIVGRALVQFPANSALHFVLSRLQERRAVQHIRSDASSIDKVRTDYNLLKSAISEMEQARKLYKLSNCTIGDKDDCLRDIARMKLSADDLEGARDALAALQNYKDDDREFLEMMRKRIATMEKCQCDVRDLRDSDPITAHPATWEESLMVEHNR